MKKIKILPLSLITLAMVGCGGGGSGSSGSDEDNFPTDLTYFTLDDYRSTAELLQLRGDNEITGTWVGVRNNTYTDANTSGPDFKRYESRLEFLVIRESAESESGFEFASCNAGGFVEIRSVTSTAVATVGAGTYNRSANNVLTLEVEGAVAPGVSLFSSSEFIRLKESTGRVGSMGWNWGPDLIVTDEDVFCAGLHNLEDSETKLSVATTNEDDGDSILDLSTETYSFTERDIYFFDAVNTLSHESADSSDDIGITITGQDVYGYDAAFNIQRSDSNNDTVVGNVSVEVTF